MPDLLTLNDSVGRYPQSLYAAETDLPTPRPSLMGDQDVDVAILGAGYTGLSAALTLAEAGVRVAVLEAHRVGFGASGRNGGQCGSGFNMDQLALEARLGADAARGLWDLSQEAKALAQARVAVYAPEAGWRPGILNAERFASGAKAAAGYAAHLAQAYGYDQMEPLDKEGLEAIVGTKAYSGGVLDHGAAHIQPLALSLGLARAAEASGAVIFEQSRVVALEPGARPVLRTGEGALRAGAVILAGNGYVGPLLPDLSARIMPINSFIVATEPLGPRTREVLARDIAVADDRFVVNYFRLSPDGRLLFGGRENYGYRFPKDIKASSRKRMLALFPQLHDVALTHAWGGTLGISSHRLPVFQRMGNIYAAAGFSGHGVALANLAGKVLAQAVQHDRDAFDLLARLPSSPFPGGDRLRAPLMMLAMTWYALRDRLGV